MIIKTHQLHLIGFGVNVKENTANDGCINYLNFQKNKIENKYFIEYIADFIWPINLRFKTKLYFQKSP